MTLIVYKRIGIIIIALGAATVSIAGLLWALLPLTPLETEASYLPAAETLFMARTKDGARLREWAALFPGKEYPRDRVFRHRPSGYPLLQRRVSSLDRTHGQRFRRRDFLPCSDTRGWVIFQQTTAETDATGGKQIGRFTVHTSEPDLLASIGPGKKRLRNDPGFRSHRRQGSEFVFLRMKALPSSPLLPDQVLQSSLDTTETMLLSWNSSGGMLGFYPLRARAVLEPLVMTSSGANVTLRSQGMDAFLSVLEKRMKKTTGRPSTRGSGQGPRSFWEKT